MKKILNILLPVITLLPTVAYADVAVPPVPGSEVTNNSVVYYAVGGGVALVIIACVVAIGVVGSVGVGTLGTL